MNTIFTIGIIESLFFFLIIVSKEKKSGADIVLISWLLILSVNILIPVFTYNDLLKYIRLNGIDYGLLVLHPIFLYRYSELLVPSKKNYKIRNEWHIVVFLINCLLVLPYILMDTETKINFLYSSEFPLIAIIGTIWVNLIYIVYLFMCGRLIILQQQASNNPSAKKEYSNLKWLKYLTIGLLVIYMLGSLLGAVLTLLGIPLYYINYYVYSAIVLYVFGLGYFGIKRKDVFVSIIQDDKKDSGKKLAVIIEQDLLFAEKLERYMILRKPFLNEKLTLTDLSTLLKVKPYYITFILNRVINKNFYDFVNYYRVEEIKKRLDEGQSMKFTLASIAGDCGFNSKASFNRIFKTFTGYSPTEYINSLSSFLKK